MRLIVVAALLLAGCAPRQPAGNSGAEAPVVWRVVSYNIRHGEGMDGRLDLERTAAALRRLDADVIALQEVDNGVQRTGGEDQAARLGALLGMNHVFGSFMDYQGGRYGLAILTHCDIRGTEPLRLTEGNEPRVALVVDVADVNDSVVSVVGVHFDWVEDDGFRFTQAGEVAGYLDGLGNSWILAGDLNDQPGSRTVSLFRSRATEAAKPGTARFTFPSNAPDREIDFVFGGPAGAWSVSAAQVIVDTLTSDHRPVVAELRALGGGTSAGAPERQACPRQEPREA